MSIYMLINSAKDELQNTKVVFLGKTELQVIKTACIERWYYKNKNECKLDLKYSNNRNVKIVQLK